MNSINLKTQGKRSTRWQEGLNCVNLFLNDFEMGLQVTEWGSKKQIEPIVTFTVGAKTKALSIAELRKAIGIG